MKKIYFLCAFFSISNNALSAEVPVSEITYIAPWTPFVDVRMSTPAIDPENCGSSSSYRIDLLNDSGSEAKLSTLLAAFMAGKQVGLSISGCLSGRPKINAVRLSNVQ
ncbi:hypothetical protein Misp06_03369 [Microbulbifer sp. NBRC 101763]|uniref:hypothetical protein n=1 Tax=Microbulbifer TaxID=48073 RepID=UPI00037DF154|nr:hypothetical protein [Microbulbifer variabilis]